MDGNSEYRKSDDTKFENCQQMRHDMTATLKPLSLNMGYRISSKFVETQVGSSTTNTMCYCCLSVGKICMGMQY